jgi:hypothetical protein
VEKKHTYKQFHAHRKYCAVAAAAAAAGSPPPSCCGLVARCFHAACCGYRLATVLLLPHACRLFPEVKNMSVRGGE